MNGWVCFLAAALALTSAVSGESDFRVVDKLTLSGSGDAVTATGLSKSEITTWDHRDLERKFWVRGKLLAPGFPLFNTDNCDEYIEAYGLGSVECETEISLRCGETVNSSTNGNFHGDTTKFDGNQDQIACSDPDPTGPVGGIGGDPDPSNTGTGTTTDPCDFLGTLCGSPLVLDTDYGGRIPTSGSEDLVLFDLNGDGSTEAITWTAADRPDPFLWLDLNHNGRADSGRELFGDATLHPADRHEARHGFDALAWYDSPRLGGNGDGIISRADEIWSRLALWTDRNHNATTDGGEVVSLEASGLSAIGLDYWFDAHIDSSGNGHLFKSEFHGAGGFAEVHDLYFQILRE